jgi:hypothetical protein
MSFLTGVQTATDFLSSVFARLWDVVISWPFVACAVMMPFVVWALSRIIKLVQDHSDFDFKSFRGRDYSGLTMGRKSKLVDIDGQLFLKGGLRRFGASHKINRKEDI